MKKTHSHPTSNTEEGPPKQESEEEQEDDDDDHQNQKPYNILQLPDHIIIEILCKIPIKTLIQCRYVCKLWRSYLSDPHFTKDLCSRTKASTTLFCGSHQRYPIWWTRFLVDLDNADDVVLKLPRDPDIPSPFAQIVGSCNGFLCQYSDRSKFDPLYISNPITGESVALPTPIKDDKYVDRSICGFGFSPNSDVYKVVVIAHDNEVLVLTVGSRIWRSIGIPLHPLWPHSYFHARGIYLNGHLHWIAWHHPEGCLLFAFDVESERVQQLPLPGWSSEVICVTLGVLRGCLSITVQRRPISIGVWMMKDYGVEESWTEELEISTEGFGSTPISPRLLKFTKEGKLLVLHGNQLQFYVPGRKGLVMLEFEGIRMVTKAYEHIPSFVSPKHVIRG